MSSANYEDPFIALNGAAIDLTHESEPSEGDSDISLGDSDSLPSLGDFGSLDFNPDESKFYRTDIVDKVLRAQKHLGIARKPYEFHSISIAELNLHRVDVYRPLVDNGHIWRFPETSHSDFRLTSLEIQDLLPSAEELLGVYRKSTKKLIIRDYLKPGRPLVPIQSCTEDTVLAFLGKEEFHPLTPLSEVIPIVPNDRYLAFHLWAILSEQGKDQVTTRFHDHPNPTLNYKALHLVRSKENIYWSLEDEPKYPYVPPVVCSRDFKDHPWLRAFTCTSRDIRQIAKKQLTILEDFKETRSDYGGFDWDGAKDFRVVDPKHCLEILPKAPPQILFRKDQDLKYSRESVEKGTYLTDEEKSDRLVRSLTSNFYENNDKAFWHTHHGPGGLPEVDWAEEAANYDREGTPKSLRRDITPLSHSSPSNPQRPPTNPKSPQQQPTNPKSPQQQPTNPKSPQQPAGPKSLFTPTSPDTSQDELKMAEMETGIYATPKGVRILLEQVTEADVSIQHRVARPIFDGTNAGTAVKTGKSQTRVPYQDVTDWPLVNRFPDKVKANLMTPPDAKDFSDFCKPFTVLPDYWKFWAIQLKIDKRFTAWRLDFNADGKLAQNFTPHGAPALMTHNGKRRFAVVDGFQLHGDVGERMGLAARLSSTKWKELRQEHYPEAKTAVKKLIYTCPGDECPDEFQLPTDWDAQGQLPPRKKPRIEESSAEKKPRLDGPKDTKPAETETEVKPHGTGARKRYFFDLDPKPTELQVDHAKEKDLQDKLEYANTKLKALALCTAKLDGALYNLAEQFATLVRDPTSTSAKLAVNQVQLDADKAVDALTKEYPSLSWHGDTTKWESQEDWISMGERKAS